VPWSTVLAGDIEAATAVLVGKFSVVKLQNNSPADSATMPRQPRNPFFDLMTNGWKPRAGYRLIDADPDMIRSWDRHV
jgi:hypothetical protein